MIAFKLKAGRIVHYFGHPVEIVKLMAGGVLVQADDATVAAIYAAEAANPLPEPPTPPAPTPVGV